MKIGLVTGKLNNDYCNDIVKYVSEEVTARNAQLIVIEGCDIDCKSSAEMPENLIFKIIESEFLDGLLVLTSTLPCRSARELLETAIKKAGKPAVSIGDITDGIPSVVFDYQAGFDSIISHLISHNISNFAFISGALSDLDSHSRLNAFLEAAGKHGLTIPQHLILEGTDGYMPGYGCARKLLPFIRNGSVEAVVCSDDELALSAVKCFKDNKLSVPGDVAVSGFNNSDLAGCSNKALTTVDRRLGQLFKKAVDVLFEQIFGHKNDAVFSITPELALGRSCGCNVKSKSDDIIFYPWTGFNALNGKISGSNADKTVSELVEYFENNNITQCYAVQSVSPAKAGQEIPKGRLFFGYAKGKTVLYPKAFLMVEILPRHILYDIKEPMVIKPLCSNNMLFGYLFVSLSGSMASFINDLASELCGCFAYIHAMNERKRLEKELAGARESLMISNKRLNELAVKENLDKLMNIRHLAANMLQSRKGAKGEYVLIIIEIDNFNEINYLYGFSEGEFVISCVSSILSKSIRDDDFLSHQCCERYVLLVKNIQKDSVETITNRFVKALDELNRSLKKPYAISFNWGCAEANIENDFEKAYNTAEQNLLMNKQKSMPSSQ